jgi:hypothetical protein
MCVRYNGRRAGVGSYRGNGRRAGVGSYRGSGRRAGVGSYRGSGRRAGAGFFILFFGLRAGVDKFVQANDRSECVHACHEENEENHSFLHH